MSDKSNYYLRKTHCLSGLLSFAQGYINIERSDIMKRPLILSTILITVFLTVFLSFHVNSYSNEQTTLYPFDLYLGDTNNDNQINILDAEDIQRHIAKFNTQKPNDIPVEWYEDVLDTDRSGYISIIDSTILQRYIAGLPTEGFIDDHPLYNWEQRILESTKNLPEGDIANYNSLPTPVSLFLNNKNAVITDYCKNESLDKPIPYKLGVPEGATKVYVVESKDSFGWKAEVSDDTYPITNLIPGRRYNYFFTNDEGMLIQNGICTANEQVRMIDAGSNTFNIRDIGGWECDGGTMKYGMIYRGCELNGDNYNITLSEDQKTFFRDTLGIRDEIDLRSDKETDGIDNVIGTDDDIKSSALEGKVDYVRYPLAPYAAGVNHKNPYQKEYYANLLKRVASDATNGKPCYIHCLVGADRTGTVCALIEAICGVSQADIERDFELTSFARNNIRVKTDDEWKGLMNYLNTMDGKSLQDMAIDFALKAGVTKAEINTMRNALIDGEPQIIK